MEGERREKGQTSRTGGFSPVGLARRFPIRVLVPFVAATALLCLQLKNLTFSADPLRSMYPAGHPFLPALEAIQEMAPETRMLIAILQVRDGDIYHPETIRKIDSITKALMEIPGVLPGGITSLTRGIDHYENSAEGLQMDPILGRRWPETGEDFRKLERRVAVNPRGLGRYVAYDGTATMISANLVDAEEEARTSYEQLSEEEKAGRSFEEHRNRVKENLQASLLEGVERIRLMEQDSRHDLCFMGPQLIEAQMTRMGRRHIPVAAVSMFVLMVAALLLRLGTVPGVLVPLAAMVLPLLWAMGMLGAGGIPFQPMALTFPVILGWFSLAYGGWIVEGYQRFYQLSGDRSQALRAAYGELRPPAPILTAGLVLVSLHASDVPMIRDFAWLGLFWWMGTMVVVLLVLPALIQLLPAPGTRTGEPGPGQPRDAGIPMLSSGGRRPLLWCLLAAILLGGGVSAGRLEIGDNVPGPSYIRSSHRWNQCFRLMADKFMGPYQLLVYARAKEEGGLLEPEAVNAIGDLSRFLRHQCGARDTVAFDMMVTEARNMLMDGNPKWLTVPVSREQVKGMGELVVEQGGVESFIDETFTEATVSPFFPEKGTGAIDEYAVRIQAYLDRNPSELLSFRLGGGLLGMTKAVNDGTRDSYWTTLITAFILVFVSGIVMTRSLVQGIVITVPIAAAQAVVWMIMVVTGMKINMPVTLVTAAAVGFCSVFGYAYGPFRDGRFRPRRSPGAVLFPGTLVFVSGVPWFFIGLRFPSQMVLVFAMSVLLAAVLSTLFVPLLAGLGRTGPPNRASEE